MNYLSWNVRGLGSPKKSPEIRSIIKKKDNDWVGLIETKMVDCNSFTISAIWDHAKVDFLCFNATPTLMWWIISSLEY